jgi:hypothetical protein
MNDTQMKKEIKEITKNAAETITKHVAELTENLYMLMQYALHDDNPLDDLDVPEKYTKAVTATMGTNIISQDSDGNYKIDVGARDVITDFRNDYLSGGRYCETSLWDCGLWEWISDAPYEERYIYEEILDEILKKDSVKRREQDRIKKQQDILAESCLGKSAHMSSVDKQTALVKLTPALLLELQALDIQLEVVAGCSAESF